MDAISDRVFTEASTVETTNDDPSLLTVILDISPLGWYNIRDQTSIQDVTKSLLVFMNAHLSLNNSNQVAFISSSPQGSKFLYPNPEKDYDEVRSGRDHEDNGREPSPTLLNPGMYRQFRLVDEAVIEALNECVAEIGSSIDNNKSKSTLSGALSMALTYTRRMLTLDQSITTTTASAINSTTNTSATSSAPGGSGSSGTSSNSITSMKSRILIVSTNDEDDIKYIPIMNCIFTAQRMKVSIDVAKLGHTNSSYLQQASDATSGVYLHIEDPRGIIQVLSTAFFVEPSIRPFIILPTNSNVNYRASCFITGKSVDLGYVCSICICIMSVIPESGSCPACKSVFDEKILALLKRGPIVVGRKKRKLEEDKKEE